MKHLFILFSVLAFSQVQTIDYISNLPRTTSPLTLGDKNEIKNVVNNNSTILGDLDGSIDLLNGGAIRTIQKVVNANSTLDFFTIQNANGVLSVDVKVVSEGNNFFLIKNHDITFVKGQQGIFINQSVNDPITHDFDVILTNIVSGPNIVGYMLSVQNKSATLPTTITMTITIGGTLSTITYNQL